MEILVKLKWNQSIGIPEETPVISSFYMYGFAVVLDEYFWKKNLSKNSHFKNSSGVIDSQFRKFSSGAW